MTPKPSAAKLKERVRCPGCRLHPLLCLCADIPSLTTRSRLVLLLHADEELKPTNTGRLAAQCLSRSQIVVTGKRELPSHQIVLPVGPDEQPVLLFPSLDARPIADFVGGDRPVVLLVPDGNWRQASRMRSRIPGLDQVPCAVLPTGGPETTYRLRTETKEGGMATLEAIGRAVAALEGAEGPAIEAAMLDVFRRFVDRILWTRGAIGDAQVWGGIPPAALAARIRG